MKVRIAVATLAAALVASCATPPDYPSPITDLTGRSCFGSFDFTDAIALPGPVHRAKPTIVDIDADAACINRVGMKSAYAMFALPQGEPYFIEVASKPLGAALFAPHLVFFDENGAPTRETALKSFLFRPAGLVYQARSHEGEAYLAVISESSAVGEHIKRVSSAIATSVMSAGYIVVPTYSDADSVGAFTFAANGRVAVTIHPAEAIK